MLEVNWKLLPLPRMLLLSFSCQIPIQKSKFTSNTTCNVFSNCFGQKRQPFSLWFHTTSFIMWLRPQNYLYMCIFSSRFLVSGEQRPHYIFHCISRSQSNSWWQQCLVNICWIKLNWTILKIIYVDKLTRKGRWRGLQEVIWFNVRGLKFESSN